MIKLTEVGFVSPTLRYDQIIGFPWGPLSSQHHEWDFLSWNIMDLPKINPPHFDLALGPPIDRGFWSMFCHVMPCDALAWQVGGPKHPPAVTLGPVLLVP